MYENVEAFLGAGNSIKALAAYDFKNESPWADVNHEKHPIRKFQKYRNHDRSAQPFDCDNSNGSCSLTNDIYKKLWGWSYENRFTLPEKLTQQLGFQWKRMGSDTMNSFQTIYICAERIYANKPNAVYRNSRLKKFAALTHSVGNFSLVPFHLNPQEDQKSFNQYRGFRGGEDNKYFVYDFFDLSLKLIKEYTSEEAFRNYIDCFFLNDYVDENYNVLPLFSRHEEFLRQESIPLDNPEAFLPQNEKELNEYLDNVNRRITARGKRIAARLK